VRITATTALWFSSSANIQNVPDRSCCGGRGRTKGKGNRWQKPVRKFL
jgi:hypothetical protein